MNRFRNFLPLVAILAVIAMAGLAPQARADFELQYSLNGGAFVTIGTTSSNPGTVSGSVDGINITGTASDSLAIDVSKLDLSVSGILSTNITSLVVEASVTGVPTTPPPQILGWTFTSSSDSGVSESAQGWVDANNNLYGGATGGPGGTNIVANTGVLTAPASGSTTFSASPPYSWTEQYNLGAASSGTVISTDDKETITTPAPTGLVLVIAGMPILGIGVWLGRRRSALVA